MPDNAHLAMPHTGHIPHAIRAFANYRRHGESRGFKYLILGSSHLLQQPFRYCVEM